MCETPPPPPAPPVPPAPQDGYSYRGTAVAVLLFLGLMALAFLALAWCG